jgi:hypothetical protein
MFHKPFSSIRWISSSPVRWVLAAVIFFSATATACAMNNSVPYVRKGLPYYGPSGTMLDGVSGYGATVGEIEVRVSGNGIDGFNGHRQAYLGPEPGSPDYGLYGFQSVRDYSTTMGADPTDYYYHGTFVAGIMASECAAKTIDGNTTNFLGMAPAARYYGAIFGGYAKESITLNNSLKYLAITSGANVLNNSWGQSANGDYQLTGSNSYYSLMMDEYAGYHGKTGGSTAGYLDKLMVFSAGNNGAGSGLLTFPADSFNGLAVGALDAVDPTQKGLFDAGRTPAARVASFSSWRPLANGRCGVQVVAPGQNLWSTANIEYLGNFDDVRGSKYGTSFAAPHVAGTAALLYGKGMEASAVSDKGTPLLTDHKLIKALIINGADKIGGKDIYGNAQSTWQPGKTISTNGVPNAIAPLNYAVGAGSANANETYLQYRESDNRFWDLNMLTVSADDQYYTFGVGKFADSDPNHTTLTGLTATLVWDRHLDYVVNTDPVDPSPGEITKNLLSNLDLILQEQIAPDVWQDVFMSAGSDGNVEHIYLPTLVGEHLYRLNVHAAALAEADLGEQYSLAVSFTAVPEPGVFVLLGMGLACLWAWRRALCK